MSTTRESPSSSRLASRKREILELAAQGHTDKEIAQQLGISLNTVATHWKQIRASLGVATRAEAIARLAVEDNRRELFEIEQERAKLLNQMTAAERKTQDLAKENEELRRLVERQAAFLTRTLASNDRKLSEALARVQKLERLDELTKELGVFLHAGYYGGSWRKTYMSDSVEKFSGGTAEDWVTGKTNHFDYIKPEHAMRNTPLFANLGAEPKFVASPFEGAAVSGPRLFLDFLRFDALDESGSGAYVGVTVDITDFADEIVRIAKLGWLEAPSSAGATAPTPADRPCESEE